MLLAEDAKAEEDIWILPAKPVLELGCLLHRIPPRANEKEDLATPIIVVQGIQFCQFATIERALDWR
jgi:hypothetical protein